MPNKPVACNPSSTLIGNSSIKGGYNSNLMKNARAIIFFIVAFLIPTSLLPVSANAQKPNVCIAQNNNNLSGCTNQEISVWLKKILAKLNVALTSFNTVANANIETRCMRLSSKKKVTVDVLKENFYSDWYGVLDIKEEYPWSSCFPDELSNPCHGAYSCDYFRNFLNSNFVARFGEAYAPAYQTLLANLDAKNYCDNEVCAWNYGQFESTIVNLWFSRNKEQMPALQAAWTPAYNLYSDYLSAESAASSAIAANDLKGKQNSVSKIGNCMFDVSNTNSEIAVNGTTYIWPNGDQKLCSKGKWISKGKTPLAAAYLTCARFNSKTDKGCWVKDNWGKLTWLFNLPMKKPKGQAVSTGSYYTENGYCQVSLYKDFAWTDSCR